MSTPAARLPAPPSLDSRPPLAPALLEIAARYMVGFDCIGSSCEDSCCRDWTLEVDRSAMQRLGALLDPAEAASLCALSPDQAEAVGKGDIQGFIERRADGTCAFLDCGQLCTLITRFGSAALPRSCGTFPRVRSSFPDHLEIHGSLACPEVARRCLLDPDSLDLVAAPEQVVAGASVIRRFEGTGVWEGYFFDVRRALVDLLRRRDSSLGARLAFAAELAARLEPFYHRGAPALLGEAGREAFEVRLASALALSGEPGHLSTLAADFDALEVGDEATAAVVVNALRERRKLPHSAAFAHLLDAVLGGYQEPAPGLPGDAPAPAALAATYRKRVARLTERFGAGLEAPFTNYAAHFLLRWPFLDSPTLLHHLCRLGIRLAAVRFLFVGHPLAIGALEERSAPAAAAMLEGAAVSAVQTFAKAVQHHPNFEKILDGSLDRTGGATFGRAICLAKFC